MPPPASSPQHRAAIDGVRGLAALGVLVFHVWLYRDNRHHGARHALTDHVLFSLNAGLILFFVLSGFLLYRAYARAIVRRSTLPGAATYARRRVARIVPAYYACGLGCLALYAAIGPHDIQPAIRELPAFAVFAQNYSLDTLMQLNPVLWTLSVEAAFYVALPLIALIAIRLGTRGHVALLLALVAIGIGFNVLDQSVFTGEIPGKTLLQARQLTRDLSKQAELNLALPPGPNAVLNYNVRMQAGTISFADTSRPLPKAFTQLTVFTKDVSEGICGINRG